MTDLARLGLQVDSTQVEKASGDLDQLTASAAGAQKATDSLAASTKGATAALSTSGTAAAASKKATDDLRASVLAGNAATAAQIQAVGGWEAAQKIMQDALKGTEAAQSAATAAQMANEAQAAASAAAAGSMAKQLGVLGSSAVQTVAALEAQTAAADTMAGSLGALGTSATRAAYEEVAAYEAAAVASEESAAVQVAANDHIRGSSVATRESLVLLREASRGNLSRMAGSLTILAQALGILQTVLIPLAGLAAVFGAALLIGTHQINDSVGDLTKGLHLTADQMDKLKGKFGDAKETAVTFMDTAKATFQVLGRDILDAIGGQSTLNKIGQWWQLWIENAKIFIAVFVGLFVGAYDGIVAVWNKLPGAVMDGIISATNATISVIQGLLDWITKGINVLIDAANALSQKTGIGTQMGNVTAPQLGKIANAYAGAGESAGEAFLNGFGHGIVSTKNALDKFYSDVTDQAKKNRIAEILKEAGKPGGGSGQVNNAEKTLAEAQDQLKAQTALNAAMASGAINLAEYNKQQAVEQQLKSLIAQRNADLKKGDVQSLEDAKKLAPIIETLRTLYGEIYDQKQLGQDMAATLQAIEEPLDKYLQTLKAIQALEKSGLLTAEQAQSALHETGLYKSTASVISALGKGNPFGAMGQISLGFNIAAIKDQATQYKQIIDQAEKAGIISARTAADARVAIEVEATEKIKQAYADLTAAQVQLGQDAFASLANGVGDLLGKTSAAYKALFAISKAFAIAQATINMWRAISEASALPWPENIPAIAEAAAQAGTILSSIAAISGFKDGVIGLQGPGTGTSDSILARLSAGESVVTANGTSGNENTLAAMNAGAKFDNGGGGKAAGAIVIQPSITIDARGAQQGVADQIDEKFRAVMPQFASQLIAVVKEMTPAQVAKANQAPRRRGAIG